MEVWYVPQGDCNAFFIHFQSHVCSRLPLFMSCTAAWSAEHLIMPYIVLFSPGYCFVSEVDGVIAPLWLSSKQPQLLIFHIFSGNLQLGARIFFLPACHREWGNNAMGMASPINMCSTPHMHVHTHLFACSCLLLPCHVWKMTRKT